MKRTWRKAFGLLVLTTIVVAACGDDDDDTAATSGGSTTTAAATTASAGAASASTAAGAATATTAAAAASDNPKTGSATSVDDFLSRMAQLYPEAIKYADPVQDRHLGDSTNQGVTDTTITIGSVTAMTTPQGIEPFGGICEGMMARIELENSRAG